MLALVFLLVSAACTNSNSSEIDLPGTSTRPGAHADMRQVKR